MGVDKPDNTVAENFARIPPPLEGPATLSERLERPEHESIKLSAHANIHISDELSSRSRLTRVEDPSAAHSGGSGGASRAAQEIAPSKQGTTQSVSLDNLISSHQAAPQIPVQIPPASNPGEGKVVLGVGTGGAQAQLAAIDAPSASNPLGQEHSSVDTHLPKQPDTGGAAKRRPTREHALRTIGAPSASNPLGQEESSVDTHLPKQPDTGGAAKLRSTRETVRTANASLPVGGEFRISDRGMNSSIPTSTIPKVGKGDQYRLTHPTPRIAKIGPTSISGEIDSTQVSLMHPVQVRPTLTGQPHSSQVAEAIPTINLQSSSSQANPAHNSSKIQNQHIVPIVQQLLILHGGSEAELSERLEAASPHPLAAIEHELQIPSSSRLLNLTNFGSIENPLNTLPIFGSIHSAGPSESSTIKPNTPTEPPESALSSCANKVLTDKSRANSAYSSEHRRNSIQIPNLDKVVSANQPEHSAFEMNASSSQRVLLLPNEQKSCPSRFWLIPLGQRNIAKFLYKIHT